MNSGSLVFLGLLLSMACSFWGLLAVPQLKIGRQEIVVSRATGQFYPPARPGLAQRGAQVYRALGCVECHTQQARSAGLGADFQRGWAKRRSVAQDYLHDYPVLLGHLRLGPDLTNIGTRQTNALWHLVHLYDPKLNAPGSLMPRYPFLFEKRRRTPGAELSPEALLLADPNAADEVVPTEEAYALVAYLLSLRSDTPLFEAPVAGAATNQPQAKATNAVDLGTNAARVAPGP